MPKTEEGQGRRGGGGYTHTAAIPSGPGFNHPPGKESQQYKQGYVQPRVLPSPREGFDGDLLLAHTTRDSQSELEEREWSEASQ